MQTGRKFSRPDVVKAYEILDEEIFPKWVKTRLIKPE